MSTTTKDKILQQIAENPIILYMKGVPSAPECGFSAKTSAILSDSKVPYAYVDVMKAPFIREKLPSVSKWPTFPQLFVKGELVGGCDIVEAMSNNGTLLPLLQAAVKTESDAGQNAVISHSEVESLITASFPQAQIHILGEGCNLEITVISEKFADTTMIKQHQGVMDTLTEPLGSGRLHAVTLKTYTPEQWQSLQATAKPSLLQIQS